MGGYWCFRRICCPHFQDINWKKSWTVNIMFKNASSTVCVCGPIGLSQTWCMLWWWRSKHTQVINQFNVTRRMHAMFSYCHRCSRHTISKFRAHFTHWHGTTLFQENGDVRFRVVSLCVLLVCSSVCEEYTKVTEQVHRKIGHSFITRVLQWPQSPSRSVLYSH
jgi:hypothetical protein